MLAITLSAYTIGYITSTAALVLWFFFQKNNRISGLMSFIFLGGILTYIYSLFNADAELDYKVITLSRDLLIMGGVAGIMSIFSKSKGAFWLLFMSLLLTFQFFYKDVMNNTFPQQKERIIGNDMSDLIEPITLAQDGELLVELLEASHIEYIKLLLKQYNCTASKAFEGVSDNPDTYLDEYILVDAPPMSTDKMNSLKEILLSTRYVSWVEGNETIKLSPMEAVPVRKSKKTYGIDDPEIDKLWGFDMMEIDALYALLKKKKIKPKKKALIAVLDTGIDAKHEDLKANYKSIKSKYDKDSGQHGTHVAGIAAAVSNNKKGIASFSADNSFVQVASVQVLSGFGGTQQTVINGMIEAADAGADVISMSLGGRSTTSRQKAYEAAVKYCNKKGAIVIVAAGNSKVDAKGFSPANTPGVITVSATDENMDKAHFSNFVNNVPMGIAAPGTNIYSTIPKNGYKSFNGTSMATPYVSGLVGMMKSLKPDLTTEEAHKILKKTGKKTKQPKATGAFIQPAKAIEMLLK